MTLSCRKPELMRIKQRNAERIKVIILAGGIAPFGFLRNLGVQCGGDQKAVDQASRPQQSSA